MSGEQRDIPTPLPSISPTIRTRALPRQRPRSLSSPARQCPNRIAAIDPDALLAPVPPFPALSPKLSRFSVRTERSSRLPIRDDGYDNYPIPLPSDPVQLERILTEHPEVQAQMAMNEEDVGPPPDGGREAWCVVGSTLFVLFCVHGLVTSFGVFQAYYLSHQLKDYTRTQVAWISSVQLTLTFAFSIFGGRYFDAHGTRMLVGLGWLLSACALLGLAFSYRYVHFMLAHALFGISGSILYTPATAVVGHWFLRKRGTATGLVSTGVGLGGVIYPIMLNRLFDMVGFRNAILIVMGMNAVLMAPANVFLKARLPPRRPPPWSALRKPFRETRYLMMLIGSCVVMLNWFSPYFNAPLFATSSLGPTSTSTISSYAVTFVQTGSLLGRATCGYLADRFGVWRVFVSTSLLAGIIQLAFWTPYPTPPGLVVVGLISYGMVSGAWISLVPPATAQIGPMKELGMRTGMIWTASWVGLLAGPVICGQLVILGGDRFTYAGVFCGLTLILGSFLTISPRIVERWRERSGIGSGGDEELSMKERESISARTSLHT